VSTMSSEDNVFSWGSCITVAKRGSATDGYSRAPALVTSFDQGPKPAGQTYHLLLDNRFTTGGAAATETLYLYLAREQRSWNSHDTVHITIAPGDVLVLDNIPPAILDHIYMQNDGATDIYRNLAVWSELKP